MLILRFRAESTQLVEQGHAPRIERRAPGQHQPWSLWRKRAGQRRAHALVEQRARPYSRQGDIVFPAEIVVVSARA